jgi:hypothetical protein
MDGCFCSGAKPEVIVRLKQSLHDGRNYLKLDYRTHVSNSSRIADHCSTHSLSDPSSSVWRQKCNHEHDEEYVHVLVSLQWIIMLPLQVRQLSVPT